MKKIKNRFFEVYIALALLFLYAPILVLMVFSFNDSKNMGKWSGFTLRWYKELFMDETILTALFNTLTVAIIASVVATIIGTVAAIYIHNMKSKKGKSFILNLNYLPVVNPDIVTGISLMLLFTALGITRGYFTMVLAHITFNIPYVVLSILPKLKQMPANLYEAAIDLGATPLYATWKVVIPQIMPGIITGFLFAFTLSLDDFVITFFTTQGTSNLSLLVYSMAKRGISPEINALSTIMFVVVMVVLIAINLRKPKKERA